jgi:exonuclease III
VRLTTWNLARGGSERAWTILLDEIQPDVAFVQEAKHSRLPPGAIWNGPALRKSAKPQPWGSALIPKPQLQLLPFRLTAPPSASDWLRHSGGAVVAAELMTKAFPIVLLSCYSPAWTLPLPSGTASDDIDAVRLRAVKKHEIWLADLVWACVHELQAQGRQVIAAGDFNLCASFDDTFSAGNREYIQRMAESELTEVVRRFYPEESSAPTFRNARSKRIEHQLDYVWVTAGVDARIRSCSIGEHRLLIENVSDHLPVIFEIDL